MDDLRDAGTPADDSELAIEGALRPTSLAEFVGQQKVRASYSCSSTPHGSSSVRRTTSSCQVLPVSARRHWR